ncbi:MAG: aminotransferase class I/II-fold pyridoxal phosphate-dependent enzyme [Erysipelotrichaceae bacterium]|nr:aminotransferase class I/II-fold pyridoxal phosphate-dependent enzyme [Erysipelotrichaceae bacterium]
MHFTEDVKEALNHKYSDMADEMKAQGRDIISLCVGEPDMKTPEYVIEGIYEAMKSGKTRYSNCQGVKELREAIANDVNKTYGSDYDASEVMITPGVKPASYFALCSLLEPNDEVVIISPYYLSYPSNVALAEPTAKMVYVCLNEDLTLNEEALDKAVNDNTKAILVNSPNNPAGSMFTKEEVEVIARIALKHPNTYVISDEVYEKLIYRGQIHHSFISVKELKDRLVVVNGYSKSHSMTGYRLGYALANSKLTKKMALYAQQTITNTSTPMQYGALAIYNHPWDHIEPYNDYLEERMNYFHTELNKHPYFNGKCPKCSFYYWVDISASGKKSIEFCDDLLEKVGIVATPGVTFGEEWDNYIRFSIASPMATLEKAIERIRDYR